jgi:hypothetical protein
MNTFSIAETGKKRPSLVFHWETASFMYSHRDQSLIRRTADRMELGMSSPLRPDRTIGYKNETVKMIGNVTNKSRTVNLKWELATFTLSVIDIMVVGYSKQRDL